MSSPPISSRRLIGPLLAIATAGAFAVGMLVAIVRCRPEAQYREEAAVLQQLGLGTSRTVVEQRVRPFFSIELSNPRTLRFTSARNQTGNCRCAPFMINVATAHFDQDRLVDLEVHDEATIPCLEGRGLAAEEPIRSGQPRSY